MASQSNIEKTLGIELVDVKETTALTKLTVSGSHTAPNGEVSAGLLSAMANANIEHLAPFVDGKAMTVEQEVNYIHKIKNGDVIEAQGSVMNTAKSTGVYQVAVSNQTGEVVFWLKGTFKNL